MKWLTKTERRKVWHRWFAWHPTKVRIWLDPHRECGQKDHWVWLETIMRIQYYEPGGWGCSGSWGSEYKTIEEYDKLKD